MSNIFQNAKFGDRFNTIDGRMALFVGWDGEMKSCFLYVEEGGMQFYGEERYRLDGVTFTGSTYHDIISRRIEPIDEDKLEELAFDKYPDECLCNSDGDILGHVSNIDKRAIFKNGYRSAKQE